MKQEDKAIMTLYMTVVKQHSQHIVTPTITIDMTIVKQLTLEDMFGSRIGGWSLPGVMSN
jgi:hypothetical protein